MGRPSAANMLQHACHPKRPNGARAASPPCRAAPVVEERRGAQLRQHLHRRGRVEGQLIYVGRAPPGTIAARTCRPRQRVAGKQGAARLWCVEITPRYWDLHHPNPEKHRAAGAQLSHQQRLYMQDRVLQKMRRTCIPSPKPQQGVAAHHGIDGARGVKQRVQQQRRARPGRQAGRNGAPVRGRQAASPPAAGCSAHSAARSAAGASAARSRASCAM